MSSIFSRPAQNNLTLETDQPYTSFEPNVQACDQFDADLIDKIKLAVAKLKATTTEHCPRKNRFAKFPCSICDKNCNKNQDATYCTSCSQWVHRKCNCTSKTEYKKLSDEPDDVPFRCMLCVMKENSEIFPHFFLDKSQLLELNGIDLPSQLTFLESYDIKSRLMNMPNLHDFDMDENLIHKVNSHYYDIIDFSRIKKYPHQFSIFHVNLRSLSAHIDELHQLLNTLNFNFDVIGISETKEQISGFLKNVSINGYDLHSQYTSSATGGVALYIKSNLDYVIREDLSILDDDFETIWVEIKNKKSQNILCCSSYRHPNTEIEKFNKYIDKVMTKITKENKLIFCMGDFNVIS